MARIKGKNIRVPTDGEVSQVVEDDKPSYAPSPETTGPTGTENKPTDTTEGDAPKPEPPNGGDTLLPILRLPKLVALFQI